MRRSCAVSGTDLPSAGRQKGIALVMVLWLVVLLTIVAASFATHSRVETRMAGNLVERQKARMLIESGLSRAMLELMVNNSQRWPNNGEVLELQESQGRVRISIRNAAGLVNLNRASRDTLYKLFALITEKPQEREQLVDALADWRDPDDLKRVYGAEDADYAHEGLEYGTVDRDLETVDELSYVMGFNRDAVDSLRSYVTVFSASNQLDERYASDQLLALLKSGEQTQHSNISAAFEQLESDLADLDPADDTGDLGQGQSDSFRISLEAITDGGARSVVDIDLKANSSREKPFSILAWHARY